MPVVKLGSSGYAVYILQGILRSACFLGSDGKPLDVDGEAGNNTIFALKDLQKRMIAYGYDCGCKSPDGVCGEKMWSILGVI